MHGGRIGRIREVGAPKSAREQQIIINRRVADGRAGMQWDADGCSGWAFPFKAISNNIKTKFL